MGIKLTDGGGNNRDAKVNRRQRLDTSSASFSESHLVAAEDAGTYIWSSSYSASSGDEIIYIKNTSKTTLLIIEKIVVGTVNTGTMALFEVTGTASGTTITGKNTNLTSGKTAEATALGNAAVTGITIGDRIDIIRLAATSNGKLELNNTLILGLNDAIAITYTGNAGNVEASVLGYYDSIENL